MIHMRLFASALLGAAMVVVGCAPSGPSAVASPLASAVATAAPSKIAGGNVTIRTNGDWGRPIDGGHTVTGGAGQQLAATMYDRLAYLDATTGKLAPYVAASWTVTPTSVTFKLRDDVTCADGTKVTPAVVYNSFAHYVAPETASPWPANSLGPRPYTLSKDDAAGTFTFAVSTPFAALVYGAAYNASGIVCPKGLESGADFTKASYGSGPYVFSSVVQGSEYIVRKRDGWNWGPLGMKSSDSGFPDTLDFKVIPNESTAANLVLTGGLDITSIGGPDVKRLIADPTLDTKLAVSGAPLTLALNNSPSRPTGSEVVRKAIVTALDPKAWTAAAGEPDAPVSTNIQANPGGYCYTDLSALMPKPSVANARQILLQDGYTAGANGALQKNGQLLKLQVVGCNCHGSGPEYLADTLRQVGFTVDSTVTDTNNHSTLYFAKGNFDVLIGLYSGDIGVPNRSPAAQMTGKSPDQGGINRLLTNDPMLETLVGKAFAAGSEQEACPAWLAWNTYVLQHAITLPWASQQTHWFSRKGEFSYVPTTLQLVGPTVRRTK